MIWEPREHLLDDRLLKDYLKRNPGAKRVLHPDPDYNPRVTAISSSPHTEASSVFAFLTLETDSTCCDDALLLVTRLKKPLIVNDSCHVQPSQLSTVPAQKPGFHPTTPQTPPVQRDIGTQSLSTSPTSYPVPLSTLPLATVTKGARCSAPDLRVSRLAQHLLCHATKVTGTNLIFSIAFICDYAATLLLNCLRATYRGRCNRYRS